MGKRANERRREIFNNLRKSGKLAPPQRTTKRMKKKKPVTVVVQSCYCRDRYQNALPSGFRNCVDCPLDNTA